MSFTIRITPELRRQFQAETSDHLNIFEKHLTDIEKNPRNPEPVHAAFRAIHTIKGNSDYLGVADVNLMAHALEDLISELRSGNIAPSDNISAILFRGLDLLRDMNSRITDEHYQETDISEITERIRQIIRSENSNIPENIESIISSSVSEISKQEIRVSVEKIDEFITRISELTVAKNTLNFLIEQGAADVGLLRKTASDISRIANTLQTDVIKLRLVRLDMIFDRLPRIIRELCSRNGKKISLNISECDIEVDRKIIEQLTDPLIHLIRNAADHGIESPDERVRHRKPETGVIEISAYQEGRHAVIAVKDDGKGLDTEKIRQAALQRKLFSESALSEMDDNSLTELIFMPGFSTRTEAGTVSGRGVGLDIVKKNITNICGTVSVCFESGVSTCFTIRVPVSMSLTDVLLAEVCGKKFAFPLLSVVKAFIITESDLMAFKKGKVVIRDDTVIPIRCLADLLGMQKQKKSADSDGSLSVIVITYKEKILGVGVDRILKPDSLVIKPLAKSLIGIREFAGSALLGDGSVILVIDPMGIT